MVNFYPGAQPLKCPLWCVRARAVVKNIGLGNDGTGVCVDGFIFPMTQADCRSASNAAGIEPGGVGYDFAGDYGTKGCYMYTTGTYGGHSYFGTGGSDAAQRELGSLDTPPKMRFSCDRPQAPPCTGSVKIAVDNAYAMYLNGLHCPGPPGASKWPRRFP